jgi:hypothetical protein
MLSPNVIRVIKSRKMRWVECVAHMGEMRNASKILIIKPEGRSFEYVGIDGKISEWIIGK